MQYSTCESSGLRIKTTLRGGSAGEEKGVDVCQTSGWVEKD